MCSICGSENYVVEHHESYYPEKTIWVCRSCHQVIHKSCKTQKNTRPKKYYSKINKHLVMKISEPLLYRLDLTALLEHKTRKMKIIEILDARLPPLEEKERI